jgi:hypothetical protein
MGRSAANFRRAAKAFGLGERARVPRVIHSPSRCSVIRGIDVIGKTVSHDGVVSGAVTSAVIPAGAPRRPAGGVLIMGARP